MKILHDVHNHNIFSNCCNDPWASTDAFVKKEVELGNKIFGLSNHIWDESVKGASGWYSKQTITKAEEAKASLAKAPKELKCLSVRRASISIVTTESECPSRARSASIICSFLILIST